MNYKLRDLLSGQKFIGTSCVFSYAEINRTYAPDPEEHIKRRMADRVAHAIAGDIMRGGTWRRSHEPEGEMFTVKGVWMDYDALYRLAEEAYALGMLEARRFGVMEGGE